jgi:hypothetical protein
MTAGGIAAAAAGDKTTPDVRSLAAAESTVLGLLNHYQATASWRSAFSSAVSTQNNDLATLESDFGGSSSGSSNLVTVPSLINVELDHAEAKLQADGLRYTTVGGGAFGIVIAADWTVCSQHPAGGTRVAKGSSVELDVEKFGCSS